MHVAVEKENIEIIKLLLSNENVDVNIQTVHNYSFFEYNFKYKKFNIVSNQKFFNKVWNQ